MYKRFINSFSIIIIIIELAEESPCFLTGPLDCVTEAKNVNVCYNFDVRSHITAKRDNGSEESAYK